MDLAYLENYFGAMVQGVPLLLVVVGLVEWIKAQGVSGNALRFASMGVGLLFGGGYMLTQARPPVGDWYLSYVFWFGNVVYGLGLGVVASGLWDTVRRLIAKAPASG